MKTLSFAAALVAALVVTTLLLTGDAHAAVLSASGLAEHLRIADASWLAGIPFAGLGIKELREQRAKLVKDAQELLAKGEAITADEEARFDTMMAEADKLKVKIDREERAAAAAAELENAAGGRRSGLEDRAPLNTLSDDEKSKRYRAAFRNFIVGGRDALSPEDRQLLQTGFQNIGEQRAAQTITTTGGGYTIPTDLVREMEKAMKDFGGIRSLARVIRTDGGNPLNWPTVDDTGNKATLVSINTQSTETAVVFGQKVLDAFAFRSLLLVPFELLQDSAFNLDVEFPAMLAERIARGTADYFATGTGSSQPQGIAGASTAGYTAAASNAIAYNDLVELVHSVDPAYRRGPSAAWCFNDSTLKTVKKMVDSENRPLWVPGVAVREPDTLLGYRYAVDQSLASIEASAKSMFFGDWSKFVIRDVAQMIMLRLTERYADYGQVGMFVFSRHDSELMDGGTHPIKHLLHPSP